MMPRTDPLQTVRPTDMQICGKVCMKFVVPSIGSRNQVGASVNSGIFCIAATLSSAMILKREVFQFSVQSMTFNIHMYIKQ